MQASSSHFSRQRSAGQTLALRAQNAAENDGICRKPQSRLVNPLILLS